MPAERRAACGRAVDTSPAPRPPFASNAPSHARHAGRHGATSAADLQDDVAFTEKVEIDKSYVRCLKVLLAGQGYPMIATHDPRMIQIASSLASRFGRRPGTYEFQMLYGIRPEEQKRLAAAGETMRVYIPYGTEWYGYLMRRLAEKPQNLAFFARSLVSKK